MSKPLYRHSHQLEKERWRPVIAAGDGWCHEKVCLFASRVIPASWAPTQLWHLAHDIATGQTLGPAHRRCNLAERNRRVRNGRRGRKPIAMTEPTGRWTL